MTSILTRSRLFRIDLFQDHPGRWCVDAGDRDNIEPQIEGIVRVHAPPFPIHRRDTVHGSRPLCRSVLCHFHFCTRIVAHNFRLFFFFFLFFHGGARDIIAVDYGPFLI